MALTAPQPDDWRTQQAIVLQSADAAVIRLLKRAQRDINAQLREVRSRPAGVGRDVREAQLNLIRRNLSMELGKTWRELGNLIEARRAEAVARSINFQQQMDTFTLLSHGVPGGATVAENIARTEAAQSSRGIDNMMARTSGASYVPLSRRVYNSNVGINSQVDRMVNSALARGLSADEFAKELERFINPNTPGGIRYAALRLARTEINNAAHAQAVSSVQNNPWVKRMKWHLSGSHPKPDICNRMAEGGPNGDGTYPKEAVPAKPHPQCFCYVTAVTENDDDDDAFLDDLVADYIATNQAPTNPTGAPVAPPPAPTPTSPTQPPRPGAATPSTASPADQAKHAKDLIASGKTLPEVVEELKTKYGMSNAKALLLWQKANREHKAENAGRPAPAPDPSRSTASQARGQARVVGGAAPNPLGLTPEQEDHLQSLVNLPAGDHRENVLQELRSQNTLAPNVMRELNAVHAATHADRVRTGSMEALAWYQPWNREIFLGGDIFTDRYRNTVWHQERSTNWCSRTGHNHDGSQSVLAHEFGHHVHTMLDRLSDTERRSFWEQTAAALGLQPPRSVKDDSLELWLGQNKYAIVNQVSKYGSTHPGEMMAEIWQEYSTSGAQSRPAILKIGQLMQRLAEEGADQ